MECLSIAQVALSSADEATLLLLVNENLCHPASAIQEAAAAVLHAMARAHLKGGMPFQCSRLILTSLPDFDQILHACGVAQPCILSHFPCGSKCHGQGSLEGFFPSSLACDD